jgi:uncharacterized membrane protein YfcA
VNLHSIYWHLPPLVLAVSFVYAATRHEDWGRIAWRTLYWVRYILGFLGSAFVVLVLLEYFWEDWWKPALGALTIWLGWKYVRRTRSPKSMETKTTEAANA